jgi:uncharacterized protein
MYSRLLVKPVEIGQSFFLLGPRGTGKSTWLSTVFTNPDTVRIDLLKSELYTDLLARPRRIESFIPRGYSDWVVIDEVQRVPALLNEVHRLMTVIWFAGVHNGRMWMALLVGPRRSSF